MGTGNFAEVNSANDAAIRNQPGLNSANITAFTAGQAGTQFVMYVQVFTEAGDSIQSEHATITLGDVPGKPTTAPAKNSSQSSSSRLLILYPALSTAENGGLPILSYSLEMDDGAGGAFSVLTGYSVDYYYNSLATSHLVATNLTVGATYRVRYRARNAYGWGEYSDTASLLAAEEPSKPSAAPVILSKNDTDIAVLLDLDIGNGGAPLSVYHLEINAGGEGNDVYRNLTSYNGTATHTINLVTDSLTYGTIYKLRYRAENIEGAGAYSDVTLVALNAVPAAVPTPVRVESGSNETAIAITWQSMQPAPELSGNTITGYKVYAAVNQSNVYTLLYNGTGYPDITSTIVTNLVTGSIYDFKVSAINFNGEGAQSTTALRTYSCQAPSGVASPVRVDSSSSTSAVTLSWAIPTSTGGCPITGYALFRNEPDLAIATNGTEVYVEVNSANDANIRNKPQLLQTTVTNYLASSVGKEFKYVVEAFNVIGGTQGNFSTYILATAPAVPTASPVYVAAMTSSTQITVQLPALVGDVQTGGAEILSYALQMSNNTAPATAYFVDVVGTAADSMGLQHTVYNVEKGNSYAFRYRARNQYGWSTGWSPVTYAVAADPPAVPDAPTLVSADDTSITINITLPGDNGGQSLSNLELWRDAGDQAENPTYTQVTSYVSTSFSTTHTVTIAADGLVLGKAYRFRTLAKNAKGSSESSNPLSAAVVAPPTQPAAPTADMTQSGTTSLFMRWTTSPSVASKSPGGDILGYQLLMATPESGDVYEIVFDSVNNSTQLTEHLVGAPDHDLTTGAVYRFRVKAYNFNGASMASSITSVRVCGQPSGLAKPVKLAAAATPSPSITIQWDAPTDVGGCPIQGYIVYVDDGAAGAFAEANSDNDTAVRNAPTLRHLQVTRGVSTAGATYRLKVVAHNEAGLTESPVLGVVLAQLPS